MVRRSCSGRVSGRNVRTLAPVKLPGICIAKTGRRGLPIGLVSAIPTLELPGRPFRGSKILSSSLRTSDADKVSKTPLLAVSYGHPMWIWVSPPLGLDAGLTTYGEDWKSKCPPPPLLIQLIRECLLLLEVRAWRVPQLYVATNGNQHSSSWNS